MNHLYVNTSWGMFLGRFDENQNHRHYALQLTIPLEGSIAITMDNHRLSADHGVWISSNIEHQLELEGKQLVLLINPTSTMGHYFQQAITKQGTKVGDLLAGALQQLCLDFLAANIQGENLIAGIDKLLEQYNCECQSANHWTDARITKGLVYLQLHHQRVVSLTEIADHCCLSESRFLHLFKEQTGLPYRRAQLWIKLVHSMASLRIQSITTTAHQFGFTDSAHYSKTFKEHFGFSPKALLKVSQFIQV